MDAISPAARRSGPRDLPPSRDLRGGRHCAKAGRFDGLYLGRREGRRLAYAGKLERGITDEDKRRVLESFERLKSKTPPIEADRKFPKARWLKPRLLVDAEYRARTREGLMRHPSFKGLRRDLMD
ncbi:MAG: hypothetical protein JO000_02320 [Alphaproteobacteria bacterium]|nr:hypothetical protein [Alphaproteobacteria bacterium]